LTIDEQGFLIAEVMPFAERISSFENQKSNAHQSAIQEVLADFFALSSMPINRHSNPKTKKVSVLTHRDLWRVEVQLFAFEAGVAAFAVHRFFEVTDAGGVFRLHLFHGGDESLAFLDPDGLLAFGRCDGAHGLVGLEQDGQVFVSGLALADLLADGILGFVVVLHDGLDGIVGGCGAEGCNGEQECECGLFHGCVAVGMPLDAVWRIPTQSPPFVKQKNAVAKKNA